MGTATTAEIKRNWFIKRFQKAKERGISLSRSKIVAEFCLKFYSSDRLGKEFLTHFRDAGMILIKNDEIMFKNELYDEILNEITGKYDKTN